MSSIKSVTPVQERTRQYLIRDLIPSTGVHLIAGPSGSGKTTWMFQTLTSFMQGEPVLDHPVYPANVFYVAVDRDEEEIEETMQRVGMPYDLVPYMSLMETSWGIDQILQVVPPETRWLVIEGIAALVTDAKLNDYKIVADFLKAMRKVSKLRNMSILGSVHTTKTKENERFENPRQRILGSVAWAAFSGNIILIEPEKPRNITDKGRILLELPRNSPAIEHHMTLDDHGRLIPAVLAVEDAPRLMLLADLPRGRTFTRADAMYLASKYNVSEATVDRWLRSYVREGHTAKIDGGYIRPTLTLPEQAAGVVLETSVKEDA